MKYAKIILVLFAAAALLLAGCAARSEEQIAGTEPKTKLTAPSETEAIEAEAVESATAENAEPTLTYDKASRTISVTGGQNYLSLSFPEEVQTAQTLEVEDDEFTLSVYLPLLRDAGWDLQEQLPDFIDRTDRSLRFVRDYLRENAASVYPTELAEKRVAVIIDRAGFGYTVGEEQITLRINGTAAHREYLYLLSLLDSKAVGWEQLGYAWYLGSCIDPEFELLRIELIGPESPYYPLCIDAGIDPVHMTEKDMLTMYGAVSRLCLERGLTHWGSACESAPVTSERPIFTRTRQSDPGDKKLSAFMATSFLGWLDENYGFEQVSLFCFGRMNFEEAFGTDFETAFEDWKAWIIETYPLS